MPAGHCLQRGREASRYLFRVVTMAENQSLKLLCLGGPGQAREARFPGGRGGFHMCMCMWGNTDAETSRKG